MSGHTLAPPLSSAPPPPQPLSADAPPPRPLAAGRIADGEVELEQALAFYRSVDASAYVAQIESALAGAQSDSA